VTPEVRVLLVEDSEDDAALVMRELRRHGYAASFERVEDATAMRAALTKGSWDVVISDWKMPNFSAAGALQVLQETALDIPFIIVSGSIGEDTAVEAMRAGAQDFVLKDRLTRLMPAIERELREAKGRGNAGAALRRSEEQLRNSEARFRALIERSADIISLTAADGSMLYLSPAVESALGYAPSELVGTSAADLCHPDDRERVANATGRLLTAPSETVGF